MLYFNAKALDLDKVIAKALHMRFSIFSILMGIPFLVLTQSSGLPLAGARGLAMGGVGLTFTDIHASWSNPAGLASLDQWGAAVYGEQRYGQEALKQVNAAVALPTASGTFSLNLGYFGYEAYNEQTIGLSYGRRLFDRLSVGLQILAFSVRIPEYGNTIRPAVEVGLYSPLNDVLHIGLKLRNPIRINLLEDEDLPTILSFGAAYHPSKSLGLFGEVEKDIQADVRFRFGLEYELLEDLPFRLGVATAPTLLSFGLGYRVNEQLRIDAAANYHDRLGVSPGVSIRFNGNAKS